MRGSADGPRGPIWRLVARVLPRTPAGRSMLGDLIEDHRGRPPGPRRALWLTVAAVQLIAAYLPARWSARAPRGAWLQGLGADLRAGARSLRRDRHPALLAILALAIGSGSVTAILTIAWTSLLRPLPFPDPDRLVVLGDRTTQDPLDRIAGNIALPNVRDLAAATPLVQSAAAYRDTTVTISGAGHARQVRAQDVETAFFDVLRVPMRAGRPFIQADADADVAVLSEALWRQLYGGDPEAVGRTILIDAQPHVIVGVSGTATQLGNPALWRPLRPTPIMNLRRARQVYAVARLAPGVAPSEAAVQLATRFDALRAAYPEIGPDRSIGLTPITAWLLGREGPRLLYLLSAVVAAVLIIACFNAALLMIVRTEYRQHELALRAALGAGRVRLLRLIVCEAVLLTFAGAALGLVFAMWATRLIVRLYGPLFPRVWEIELHAPVVAGTLAIAAAVALAISLLPALRLRRAGLQRIEPSSRSQPLVRVSQRVLVGVETAAAVAFLVTGGLIVQSVWNLTRNDLGVDAAGAVLFDISLRGRQANVAAAKPFVDSLLERFDAIPGVNGAAAATRRPLSGGNNSGFTLPGRTDPARDEFVEIRAVTPGYFSTLGMRVTAGRGFTGADGSSGSPVIVNDAFVRRYLPGGAVHQPLRVSNGDRTYTIVGVVSDVLEFGPSNPARPTAYWPFGNWPYSGALGLTVILRVASGSPVAVIPDARAVLTAADPHVALDDPVSLEEFAANRSGPGRLAARTLLLVASAVAVTLAMLGLYGVVSFSVAVRRREIGIRRALGSTPAGVVRLFVRQGLLLALPGVILGLLLSRLATRGVAHYLHEVTPGDPVTYVVMGVAVTALAALSSWLPARRASRIETSIVLLRE